MPDDERRVVDHRLTVALALIRPEAPAEHKAIIGQYLRNEAGLPQGKLVIQRTRPFPPLLRPPCSSAVNTLKAVTIEG